MRNTIVNIDDTHFIYTTNFSGDPTRDKYGSARRRVNVVIPTQAQADDLARMGVKVKVTRPNPERTYEGEFVPTYFVAVNINMESKWPPKIWWVTPTGARVMCSIDTIGKLDYIRVKNVCCQAKLVENKVKPGEFSLYADIMYIEQDVDYDPYAQRYGSISNDQ